MAEECVEELVSKLYSDIENYIPQIPMTQNGLKHYDYDWPRRLGERAKRIIEIYYKMRPKSRRSPRIVACAAFYFCSSLTQKELASLGQVNGSKISNAHLEIFDVLIKPYGANIFQKENLD